MTTRPSKRQWLARNLDIVVLTVIGTGLAAIAITGFIAVGLVLIRDREWRGDFAWFATKNAFWAGVQFAIASLLWENRSLKWENRSLKAKVRFLASTR